MREVFFSLLVFMLIYLSAYGVTIRYERDGTPHVIWLKLNGGKP